MGREKATGQGIVYVLDEMLPAYGMSLRECTFSIVGFGNVGSWTSKLLHDRGCTLKAVSDHTGFLYEEKGIDPFALARHVEEHGSISGFPLAEPISEEAFYCQPVDLFIPAALEQMIDLEKAEWLRCKVIVEAANLPLQPVAEAYLLGQGTQILPAVLCNAGGVTVSYFEWKQNRQAETWDLERVDRRLKRVMTHAAQRVKEVARQQQCDLRVASYCAALDYINEVYEIRGIFP